MNNSFYAENADCYRHLHQCDVLGLSLLRQFCLAIRVKIGISLMFGFPSLYYLYHWAQTMIVKRAALSQCRYYRESPVQSSQVTVVLLCSTFITNCFCGGTLYQSVRGMKLSYWSLYLPITPLEREICLFNASKTVSPFLRFYFLMSEILTGSVSSSSRQLFLMINLVAVVAGCVGLLRWSGAWPGAIIW